MAAPQSTTSAKVFAIFKQNYDSGSELFVEQQNLHAYSFSKFSVSALKPTEQGIQMPVTMAGNEAGGAISETQTFQQPGSIDPVRPVIMPRQIVWPFQVTGRAIELSETNKQAFGMALDVQQEDNFSRMFSDLNRQSLTKGTGQIALAVGAGVASTSLVVDDPFRFRRNMRLESYATPGGPKEIDGATITEVNYTTSTLTISPAQTWSDGSIIKKYEVGPEMTGLQAICDTNVYSTTFESVSVTANPEWKGNVVSAGNAPVSQDLLQQTLNRIAMVGGGKPNYLLSNYGQARVFLNTELQKVRYEPLKVEGGHTVLKWNQLEWLVDKDYDLHEVGLYDLRYVEKFQTRDVHLSDLSGNTLYQIVGQSAVGGYYEYFGNLGTWKRNAHGRLIDLTEPAF